MLKHLHPVSVQTEPPATGDTEMLDKLSRLNNELVNAQRSLQKKNEEISNLNIELSQANAHLQQLMYGVSHDLKEPLRMVTSFMLLLQSKYGQMLDEKANAYIGFAVDGGKRMQAMITDLLELSHTANNSPKEVADVAMLFAEARQNLAHVITKSNAVVEVTGSLPSLKVNRTDIVRLFQNLIGNAIKFCRPAVLPVVSIQAIRSEGAWVFSVSDNGIGIAADQFESIFGIFNRLHSYEAYEGTGIGLASCKKIVADHGGKLWLDSKKDVGTTFYFTIPEAPGN